MRLVPFALAACFSLAAVAEEPARCIPPSATAPAPATRVAVSVAGPSLHRSVGADAAYAGGDFEVVAGGLAGFREAKLSVTGGALSIADGSVFGLDDSTLTVNDGSLLVSGGSSLLASGSLVQGRGKALAARGGGRVVVTNGVVSWSGGNVSFDGGSGLLLGGSGSLAVSGGSVSFADSSLVLGNGTISLKNGSFTMTGSRLFQFQDSALDLREGGSLDLDATSALVLAGRLTVLLGKGKVSGLLAAVLKCEGATCRTPPVAEGTALVVSGTGTHVVSLRKRPELLVKEWENEIDDYLGELTDNPLRPASSCGANGWGAGGVAQTALRKRPEALYSSWDALIDESISSLRDNPLN